MSFNPIQHLIPNQKDNKEKLTPAQKKLQEQKKAEISGQLRINYLRDALLEVSLMFLIYSKEYLSQEKH